MIPEPRDDGADEKRRPRHRARASTLRDVLDMAKGRDRRLEFDGTRPQVTFDSAGRVVRVKRVSASEPPPMGRRRAPGPAT